MFEKAVGAVIGPPRRSERHWKQLWGLRLRHRLLWNNVARCSANEVSQGEVTANGASLDVEVGVGAYRGCCVGFAAERNGLPRKT